MVGTMSKSIRIQPENPPQTTVFRESKARRSNCPAVGIDATIRCRLVRQHLKLNLIFAFI